MTSTDLSAATAATAPSGPSAKRVGVGALVVAGIALVGIALGAWLLSSGRGDSAMLSWLIGAGLGVVFQRGRFCFMCIFRDVIVRRRVGGMLAVLTALAVGLVGYTLILDVWVPNPASGRLPPDAHVGPVSWVLALAGVAFGLGMSLSGGCISGHLYRLGEGYARAPVALVGALIGFGLGFLTWRTAYVEVIWRAPAVWLPATFGHAGALLLQLAALLALAGLLWWWSRDKLWPEQTGTLTPARLWRAVFGRRWPPLLSGGIVGALAVIAYFRVEPLGVTAQLGSLSRTAMDRAGWLSDRLPGLDTLAGCITVVSQAVLDNGWLIMGLVLGSLAMALLSGRFRPSRLTVGNAGTALLGGVLMGWGAMLALGCTVGVLLSGIMAGALSGWVFFGSSFLGVFLGIRLGFDRSE
ncbi:MAG: YeeE/YedE family protein [Trueperaceae bacterium]|nr:YeeE/YedE family protein [Trueperaceae bacterium]